jgi:hypothetical protein
MLIFASVISYYASGKRGMNQSAFSITVLVFLMGYTAIQVYPAWLGIVMIVLVSAYIAKNMGIIGGK